MRATKLSHHTTLTKQHQVLFHCKLLQAATKKLLGTTKASWKVKLNEAS